MRHCGDGYQSSPSLALVMTTASGGFNKQKPGYKTWLKVFINKSFAKVIVQLQTHVKFLRQCLPPPVCHWLLFLQFDSGYRL